MWTLLAASAQEALALVVGHQPVRADALEAAFVGEALGPLAREEHVRRVLHHRVGERDRVAHAGHGGYRARAPRATAHDRCVHLDPALAREH